LTVSRAFYNVLDGFLDVGDGAKEEITCSVKSEAGYICYAAERTLETEDTSLLGDLSEIGTLSTRSSDGRHGGFSSVESTDTLALGILHDEKEAYIEC
jgi:hypothetical protein